MTQKPEVEPAVKTGKYKRPLACGCVRSVVKRDGRVVSTTTKKCREHNQINNSGGSRLFR